jgi:SHS2 domain-containing protein
VKRATHSLAEHTGELAIRLEAGSVAELFAEAARALAEVMLGRPATSRGAPVRVSLAAPDRDALLVAWLDELIFRAERDRTIYGDARIERLSDRALEASIRGEPATRLKTQVKAATFYELDIVESRSGVAATVVLDV